MVRDKVDTLTLAWSPHLSQQFHLMAISSKSPKAASKAAKGKQKGEKIFHPASRKAGQMEREALRKNKLAIKIGKRGKKQLAQGMS